MIKKYKNRDLYVSRIKPYINKNLIKIITGQRRVGKSYLLYQLMDVIGKNKVNSKRILYINKELYEFDEIKTYRDLINYANRYFKGIKAKKYLFIDEIQEVAQFEKALRHFQTKGDFDIYCTGSNAELLSSEIATLLSGRYISFDIYPLSFIEFLDFHNLDDSSKSLEQYIKYGGLPYLIHLELEDEIAYSYLKSVYNSVILKDVVQRHEVRNIEFLHRLILFLSDNLGSLFSAKKISDYLKSEKTSLSPQIIMNYLSYLNSAYFIHQIKRFEIRGKKVFQVNEKYFFNDLGIRHSLVGYRAGDIGKVLENLVLMHLKYLGFEVRVGNLPNKKEIDFVASRGNEIIYFQVAYVINNKKTLEREISPLLQTEDAYPKMLITMDELSLGENKGVKHFKIKDFLLDTF